ncbi:flavin reductase [Planctomycetales bacterium]|nr:flavin reductase [Planctomycetales bacterium]
MPKKRSPAAVKKSSPVADRVRWQAGTMVYPAPAALVSCGNRETGFNLITVAWTGNVCSAPAQCYISVRPERYSYRLIKETGEFAINLTTAALVRAVDWCGVKSGRDFDKFKECNLTAQPAFGIGAPVVAESPLAIECRVKQIIPLGAHDMFLAEVVALNAAGKLLDREQSFDLASAQPLVYLHGKYYALGRPVGYFGFSVAKKKRVKS